ncbi:MAG: endonuclease/exonuclease/phosphatase family protein [Haloarculaceae archaeon]
MPSHVAVMTYNVRYDNPADQEYVWRKRRDEVASVIRFHDPDLVGLQEALGDQLRDLRDRLPGYEWLPAGRDAGAAENAGEYPAIGYDTDRFNLEAEDSFWLSETPDEPGSVGWDAALPRLVKYVELREIDTDVRFFHFNTHFDHAGDRARVESAKLLRDRIDAVTGDEPIVVTGDFNAEEATEPYEVLTHENGHRRALLDAHYAASYPHHGPTTTVTDFTSLVPDHKIDHVFVSRDDEVLVHGTCSDTFGDGLYPSDHLPVLVKLSVPRRTPTA